jgi:isoquinoline 1-oxidoreductase beta subunit
VTISQLSRLNRLARWLPGPDVAIVAGAWDQPFKIPNYRVNGYRVPEMVPVSSWRSVGASGNGFFHECFLDELIQAAGADPLKERLRLCSDEPSRKVLELVGEMSNWGSNPGKDRGRGFAFTLSFGVPVAEVVEVTNTLRGIKIDKVFVAVDVGTVLDPVNFENQAQGGVIWGLGHAMNAELTYVNGIAEQTNYHAYEGMRLYQAPAIEVRALSDASDVRNISEVLKSTEVRGIGEPCVPPAAPALANAIFAATGKRLRELPLNKGIDFV